MTKKKPQQKPFGQTLRETRMGKGYSLRKFAQLVDVSPTYLSQVEQMKVDPPTADRVKRMAEILGEDVDEWTALAGRLTQDLPDIIHEQPKEMADMLRAVRGLTADQIRKLRDEAKSMKREEEE